MKKLHNKTLAIFLMALAISSCDKDYDLGKELDGDITIEGENLSLPIGSTEKIYFKDFIEFDDSSIKSDSKGDYFFELNDYIDPINFNVPAVQIPSFRAESLLKISQKSDSQPAFTPLALGAYPDLTTEVDVNFDFNSVIDFNIETRVPKEIYSINNYNFKKQGDKYPVLSVSLAFNNLPEGVNSISIKDLKITLPSFLKFSDSSLIDSDGNLVMDADLDVVSGSAKKSIELQVEGGLIDESKGDGIKTVDSEKMLQLSREIVITGEIASTIEFNIASDIPSIDLNGEITTELESCEIDDISGAFDLSIEPANFEIETEFPEELSSEGTCLDIENSAIALSIENSVDIQLLGDLSISSNNTSIDFGINIAAASLEQGTVWSNYWISSSTTNMNDDYQFIEEDLVDIIKETPDYLSLNIGFSNDKSRNSIIKLDNEYKINCGYRVYAPITLGDDFKISYQKEESNLFEDVAEYFENVKSIKLNVEATNTIPLTLDLVPTPIDSNGYKIDGVEISFSNPIKASTSVDTPVTTSGSIIIKETKEGALDSLCGLKIEIEAYSDGSKGISLNENQYISLKLSAELPDGITVNIN